MNAMPQTGVGRAERDWAAFSHAMFGACLLTAPFLGGRAIILLAVPFFSASWLAWRDPDGKPFASRHARASVNLQLSFFALYVVAIAAGSLPWRNANLLLLVVLVADYVAALALSWTACLDAAKGRECRLHLFRFLR